MNLLFVCSQNRMRSPTAEVIFRDYPGVSVRSAGVDRDALQEVTEDLLEWADIVFVMERRHRNFLQRRFRSVCSRRRIICLHVPDEFEFMAPSLVSALESAVRPILDRAPRRSPSPSDGQAG